MICDNCDIWFNKRDVRKDYFENKIVVICPYCEHGNYLGNTASSNDKTQLGGEDAK